MISSKLQLLSWFASTIIGFIYFLELYLYRIIKYKKLVIQIISDIIFIILNVISIIVVYFKLNNGNYNYTYLFFYALGSLISYFFIRFVKNRFIK